MIALALRYWYVLAIAVLAAALAFTQVQLAGERTAHAQTKQNYAEEASLEFAARLAEDKTRKENAAKLDLKFTKELSDAKLEIERLSADVRTGKRQLRVSATCTPAASTINQTTPATGVDDGTGPRLTAEAEQNYFGLRADIETITGQVAGLQQYVAEVCLR